MRRVNKNGFYAMYDLTTLCESDLTIEKLKSDNSVICRAVMQVCDVMNANRRIYPTELMDRHIQLAQPQISKRRLFGEADHPDADSPVHRIMAVRMQNASHCFNKLWIDKDPGHGVIRAVIETTPTTWGYTLASFIRRRMGIGFSLRSTGRVAVQNDVSYVTEPFKFVTYDAVINPSNESAFVEEVLEEATNCVKEKYLAESKTLTPLIERYIEAEVRDCAYKMLNLL